MRYVVRRGQKTWHGRTKQEVLTTSDQADDEAKVQDIEEIAHRLRDRAAFYRHQASRMSE